MPEKYVQFISPSWWRYLPQRQKQWQTAALCNDNSNNKMEICIVQANMSLDVLVQPRIQDTIGYSKHKRWTKLGSSSNQHWLISMSNSVPCPVGWLQRSSKINALLDKYVVNKYLTPQYTRRVYKQTGRYTYCSVRRSNSWMDCSRGSGNIAISGTDLWLHKHHTEYVIFTAVARVEEGFLCQVDNCGRKMDDCKCKVGQTKITNCLENFNIK